MIKLNHIFGRTLSVSYSITILIVMTNMVACKGSPNHTPPLSGNVHITIQTTNDKENSLPQICFTPNLNDLTLGNKNYKDRNNNAIKGIKNVTISITHTEGTDRWSATQAHSLKQIAHSQLTCINADNFDYEQPLVSALIKTPDNSNKYSVSIKGLTANGLTVDSTYKVHLTGEFSY